MNFQWWWNNKTRENLSSLPISSELSSNILNSKESGVISVAFWDCFSECVLYMLFKEFWESFLSAIVPDVLVPCRHVQWNGKKGLIKSSSAKKAFSCGRYTMYIAVGTNHTVQPVKDVIEIHVIINLGTDWESVNESNQYPLYWSIIIWKKWKI